MAAPAMNSPLACTIVANNYLAYARAFTRSFLARHPEGKVCVLIVDRPQPGHRYEDEPFAVTFADQLGIPGFPHFAFRYSLLELNTAVKPYFLLHLHRTLGVDRVCYFDPEDPAELAGWIARLAGRPEIAAEWAARAGTARIKEMDQHAEEIEAVYAQILARRNLEA